MSKIIILGAAGSLGRRVVRQAEANGHEVTAVVRSLTELPPELDGKVSVLQADLLTTPTAVRGAMISGHDALINTAGTVGQGEVFVRLVDRVVAGVESIPQGERPVCWFMAGAGLLDIDEAGRRGVDLPKISSTYWPHGSNFDRISSTDLDWRMLCPGPMVEGRGLGLERMRISIDRLPVDVPAAIQKLPDLAVLPFFASSVPEMTIAYEDAAALMLANLAPGGPMSRHRVGIALPVGMCGEKAERSPNVSATA